MRLQKTLLGILISLMSVGTLEASARELDVSTFGSFDVVVSIPQDQLRILVRKESIGDLAGTVALPYDFGLGEALDQDIDRIMSRGAQKKIEPLLSAIDSPSIKDKYLEAIQGGVTPIFEQVKQYDVVDGSALSINKRLKDSKADALVVVSAEFALTRGAEVLQVTSFVALYANAKRPLWQRLEPRKPTLYRMVTYQSTSPEIEEEQTLFEAWAHSDGAAINGVLAEGASELRSLLTRLLSSPNWSPNYNEAERVIPVVETGGDVLKTSTLQLIASPLKHDGKQEHNYVVRAVQGDESTEIGGLLSLPPDAPYYTETDAWSRLWSRIDIF